MTAPTPYAGHELPPHLQPSKRKTKAPLLVGVGVVGVLVVAIVGFLAIAVFEVQTLFMDETVEEAGPTFASGASAGEPAADGSTPETSTEVDAPAAPAVTTVATGTFTDVDHPGSGTVTLLTDGAQTFVRFEDDFATDNGPDLYAAVIVGGERVELGELRGNQGSQNYELPADIDPASVESVQVWCKRFDAVFTQADLA